MDKKSLSERDICTKFITPALRKAGWDEMEQIREEVSFTKGRIIVRGKLVSRGKGNRADYMDQRGHLNRMLRLALPFFVDATFCAQTFAQMRRHPELAVWVGDSCLNEPHRRSSRDRSGSP